MGALRGVDGGAKHAADGSPGCPCSLAQLRRVVVLLTSPLDQGEFHSQRVSLSFTLHSGLLLESSVEGLWGYVTTGMGEVLRSPAPRTARAPCRDRTPGPIGRTPGAWCGQ